MEPEEQTQKLPIGARAVHEIEHDEVEETEILARIPHSVCKKLRMRFNSSMKVVEGCDLFTG